MWYSKIPKIEHCLPYFKIYDILEISKLFKYKLFLEIVHQYMLHRSNIEVQYKKKHTPHLLREDKIQVPRSRTNYGDVRLCMQIANLLNQYPAIFELLPIYPSLPKENTKTYVPNGIISQRISFVSWMIFGCVVRVNSIRESVNLFFPYTEACTQSSGLSICFVLCACIHIGCCTMYCTANVFEYAYSGCHCCQGWDGLIRQKCH